MFTDPQKHMIKSDKRLVANCNELTEYAVKALVECATYDNRIVANIILASLFSGCSIASVLKRLHGLKVSNEHVVGILPSLVVFSHSKNQKNTQTIKTIKPQYSPYALLPKIVADRLIMFKNDDVDIQKIEEEIDNYLRMINEDNNIRLTRHRIANYLPHIAHKFSISKAELEMITKEEIGDHAGAFYLQIDSMTLRNKLVSFLNYIFENSDVEIELPAIVRHASTTTDSISKRIGSHHYPDNESVTAHFRKIEEQISVAKLAAPIDVLSLHNYFTYYTYELLAFCTGIRANINPFKKLLHFDLDSKMVCIEDKKNRGEQTSRWIPLNDLAFQQIQNYKEHLENLKSWFRHHPKKQNIPNIISEILSGERELFLTLSKDTFNETSPTKIKNYVAYFSSHKNNVNRHWIRSQLALEDALKQSAIDAFMGHEEESDESFSIYSSLCIEDMRNIASTLNKRLVDLGLKPVRGLANE